MNCHKDGKNKPKYLGHMLHMVLCCGLPIVIVGIIPVVSAFSLSASKILAGIVPFICPLMMLSMIGMMFLGGRKRSCCSKNEDNDTESNKI
ncbi:hypothetical protein [Clostridium oryzae]|uniref:DUF2933 domain-containing protein n=1 Tax=Clostridium oryzae TaxID=1450648 RepID=A0A1V4I704_9CLOT|nr:hypothetical protein [Clostridium oryzae]OPJ55733.1 hypothetical protein CLORY_43570 [Clostridium oryzae]